MNDMPPPDPAFLDSISRESERELWSANSQRLMRVIARLKAETDAYAQSYADARVRERDARIAELERLVVAGRETVLDFMPNVGKCVLQDYGRLNRFLYESDAAIDRAMEGTK